MRVYGKGLFHFSDHLSRLDASCRAIGERLPLGPYELKRWLESALRDSGHAEATLRVSAHWDKNGRGRLVVFVSKFEGHPRAWYEEGVALRTAVGRRWTLKAQDPQIKSSQYVSGVLAMSDIVRSGLDPARTEPHELLFFGSGGTVAEGTVSNLFIVKEKCLLTPSVASGILKGVTRGIVIGLAEGRGWTVRETQLTRHDFYSADECFLTNTSSEVLPVVNVDGRAIGGQGEPGPLTRTLGDDFRGLR